MSGVTHAKGLSHLPTATSRRLRARPPQRGAAHLEMYLVSTERERLEQELAHLDERRERIQKRRAEICEELARLRQVAQQEEAGGASDGAGREATATPAEPSPAQAQPPWRTMSFDY